MTGASVLLALLGFALLIAPCRPRASGRLAWLTGQSWVATGRRSVLGIPARCALAVAAGVFVVCGGPGGLALGVCAGAMGYWLAEGLIRRRTNSSGPVSALRLAAGWDLLAACLRSGMPVPAAVRCVAEGAPVAAAEGLRSTADLLTLGANAEDAWAPARASPATAEFARAAGRAARSGTALADVASGLADRVRASRQDAVESRAQRAGVLITGPLALCFLPAFLCLGVVPVVLGLASQLTVMR